MARYPQVRMRRLRRTAPLRAGIAETRLGPADLVAPLFVKAGIDAPRPVPSMPGVQQHTVDSARAAARDLHGHGVVWLILFGVPEHKDASGSSAWASDGPVPTAARAIRADLGGDVVLWADVCSCEYTDHGHCGPLTPGGDVDNDAAVAGYVRAAKCYADAGVDAVAPSGMMDGQVAAIRGGLDEAGHDGVAIVAYAAKFASGFYGPFREAAESGMRSGDRAGYQMDPANRRQALREMRLDALEGADMLMVKPALPYLDVLAAARAAFDLPLAAYQVSGEYAMLAAAAERGWVDGDRVLLESLLSIKRAGADLILTYGAPRAAALLHGDVGA